MTNSFYELAISTLSKAGIEIDAKQQINAIVPLVAKLEAVDQENALLVARTMQQSSLFNDVVREKISSIEVGARFIKISTEFESIREDLKQMVGWLDDGVIDWKERIQMKWMNLKRGSVGDRFEEIRIVFNEGIEKTDDQIQKESFVLEAYKNFRFAIKQAESNANEILKKAEAFLLSKKHELEKSAKYLETANVDNKTNAELERDVAIENVKGADNIYQIAKDLVDNLRISYNTSEVIYARLEQNIAMKQRIYEQSVSFFSTNENVFTALAATFTSTRGLSEDTHALNSLKDGINSSLDVLSELGNTQLEKSIKAGYGPTIEAKSIERLANSIVDYQLHMKDLVEKYRKEATENSLEIERVTNESKQKFQELLGS